MALIETGRFSPALGASVRDGRPIQALDAVPLLTVFLALLVCIPAQWVVPGLGAAGRPASLFGCGLFALWCGVRVMPGVSLRKSPLRWLLLLNAMAIMAAYGAAFDRGPLPVEALAADRALIDLVSTTGVVLMASEGLPTTEHSIRLAKRLSYFAGFAALIGVIQFITRWDPYSLVRFPGLVENHDGAGLNTRGSGDLIRVKGPLVHPIEFAIVMALALPFALHCALHEANRFLRRRRMALAGLIAVASLLAISRSAIVGVAAAGIVLFWGWSPRFRMKAAAVSLMGLVVVRALVPGLLGTLLALFTNWSNDNSVSGRTDDYSIAGQYIADRPWFGRGDGTFIPDLYITLDNAYLGRLITTGFVGLATLLAQVVAGLVLARHAARRHPSNTIRHLGVATMATIFVAFVSGGTFDFYSFPTSSSYLYIALGLAAAISRPQPGPAGPAPAGLLRLGYTAGYRRARWWERFTSSATKTD